MAEQEVTIVRQNLMEQPGYTPYCGADTCKEHWPRTTFNGQQFKCKCGWQSFFPEDFIERYKIKWNIKG